MTFADAVDRRDRRSSFCASPTTPPDRSRRRQLVQKLLRRCAACGAVLVVDECFLDFLPDRDALTAKRLLHDASNLIILKAFTKLYAMAGVRLGYALCSECRAAGQNACGGAAVGGVQPCAGGRAGSAGRDCLRRPCAGRSLPSERPSAGSRDCVPWGCRVVEGPGKLPAVSAPRPTLARTLRRRGAVVRSCANYPGLDGTLVPRRCAYQRGESTAVGKSCGRCWREQSKVHHGAGHDERRRAKACCARRSAAFLRRTATRRHRSKARTWR